MDGGVVDGVVDGVDPRVLERVRALLAKAESTPYPAEAETFTAGAQALMARHSIDRAMVDAAAAAAGPVGPRARAAPGSRRIGIVPPYESPKVVLLGAVATANRSRCVWNRGLGFCTVVGFAADLDAVEVLFTSLLLQATAEMTRQGGRTDAWGRSTTRSFRHSFLVAFADRIGERLAQVTRVAQEEAEREALADGGGRSLLPVLADRAEAVRAATDALFPRTRTHRASRPGDAEGWYAGRAAADRAALSPGQALPGRG